jgi:hypothetical protein
MVISEIRAGTDVYRQRRGGRLRKGTRDKNTGRGNQTYAERIAEEAKRSEKVGWENRLYIVSPSTQ